MPTAVFRADAGPGIGNGHVARSLAVAESLAERGWHCCVAGNAAALAVASVLGELPFRSRALVDPADPAELISTMPEGCDCVVMDHYGLGVEYHRALRPWARNRVVISDHPAQPVDADVVVDPTPGRSREAYGAVAPPDCEILAGAAFALLRRQFRSMRDESCARDRSVVRRILVAMGGVDSKAVVPKVLAALALSGVDCAIDLVAGSGTAYLDELRRDLPSTVRLHVDRDDMAGLLREADLAIGASGVGVLERCCLGVPNMLLTVADNQHALAGYLVRENAAIDLGPCERLDGGTLVEQISQLVADRDCRLALSRRGAEIIDGAGADRVAERVSAKRSAA